MKRTHAHLGLVTTPRDASLRRMSASLGASVAALCLVLSLAGCDRKSSPATPNQPMPSGGGAHSDPPSGGTTYTSDTYSYSLTYGPEWKSDPKEAARRRSPIAPADLFLHRSRRDTNFWICADKHPFDYT